ncbi:SDR family oxidoreductase [Phormidium sp. FACHB-1136]|uniref:SDR family NAD(P)-dependent oxidoreductase n=1 Tax=Phormidium sp. FACHB-1136 TaxID=2692848 RepID=UPI0018EFB43E|nr:SDR family oxidoreductase [Phormidium sp. FACHB-1136]
MVTGASRGIGLAIATALHREGCSVALNARQLNPLYQACSQLPGSLPIVGDVSCFPEAQKVVAEVIAAWGRLDILICNVGSGQSVSPGTETPDEWQRVFALNLWSATNMVSAATEALVLTQGSIVCISSICGLEVIPGAPVTYSAAKAALNAYVRGIARPLGQKGVRINAIAPGNILCDGSVWARRLQEDAAAVTSMLNRDVALRRLGTPEEIANLVCYLASPYAGFASGALWTLDGGQVRH